MHNFRCWLEYHFKIIVRENAKNYCYVGISTVGESKINT